MQMGKDVSRVLAFFAHPDDETLAAGATLATWAARGVEVHVAIPGTGITSRGSGGAAEIEALREQGRQAMQALGLSPDCIRFGDFPDNAMDSRPLLELIQWLEEVMANVQPDLVLTHHNRCTNIDHQYCHEAAVVACRPAPGRQVALWTGEVPSSTGYLRPTAFEPNVYVSVSEADLERKVSAMLAYDGEVQPDPYPRSPEVLRALAKVRGSESGNFFAEAFMIQRAFG